MAHMLDQRASDRRGKELTRLGRVLDMLGQLLFANTCIVQLIVMDASFQVVCGDGLIILRDLNGTGDLQDALGQ